MKFLDKENDQELTILFLFNVWLGRKVSEPCEQKTRERVTLSVALPQRRRQLWKHFEVAELKLEPDFLFYNLMFFLSYHVVVHHHAWVSLVRPTDRTVSSHHAEHTLISLTRHRCTVHSGPGRAQYGHGLQGVGRPCELPPGPGYFLRSLREPPGGRNPSAKARAQGSRWDPSASVRRAHLHSSWLPEKEVNHPIRLEIFGVSGFQNVLREFKELHKLQILYLNSV